MDTLTTAERSENMRRIRGKNTTPELAVRRIVSGLGYRYRIHAKSLPGKPDIALQRLKKAIFVHGCFWHLHPSERCKDSRMPKSRVAYWKKKLNGNRARDKQHLSALKKQGWNSLVIWECWTKSPRKLSKKLASFLSDN
jgi:DNA mismatch endonuclease (patch repair protein)